MEYVVNYHHLAQRERERKRERERERLKSYTLSLC